ncbi:Wall-associated receptor kinase [Macleaya cordata]|uniref:Wall-associated receptor kinase n=1 Tax=Macleaya cordata TaxID=56857 RepID=A0A200QN91_MACCD|nr:Wall-associated receptor kinase [Macleaya cordata]
MPYTFSDTQNRFFTVGCDTLALILMVDQQGKNYTSQCLSACNTRKKVIEGSCSGSGCCQIPIPKGLKSFVAMVASLSNHTNVWSFNPCSYAFMAEQEEYTFGAWDLMDRTSFVSKTKNVTVALNWAIGDKTCEEAKKDLATFACQANSYCNNSDNSLGYHCTCYKGYEGNPYLSPGCQGMHAC